MRAFIKQILNNSGLDIVRYPSPIMRSLGTILETNEINLVLDVGANDGWYSKNLRRIGYNHKIISFEPLDAPFEKISRYAKKNPANHLVMNCALGHFDGTTTINISQNSVSSSILEATATLNTTAPQTKFIESKEIKISKLDTVFSSLYNPESDKVFLKLDVQGYEMNVLEGAMSSLSFIEGIQLEVAFVELYKGEKLFQDILFFIQSLGFELYLIMPGFLNESTGRMMEADCVFMRKAK